MMEMISDLWPETPTDDFSANDASFIFCEAGFVGFATGVYIQLMVSKSKEANVSQLLKDYSICLIDSGWGERFCMRALASFANLEDPADANENICQSLSVFQYMVEPDGSAALTLARIAATTPDGVALLRTHLLYAIEHGAQAPRDRNGNTMEVKAANALAFLFGREEVGDDDTIAVPPRVIATVIGVLKQIMAGEMDGYIQYAIKSILALSLSDANTKSMVEGGVLELIATVLTKGREVGVEGEFYKYVVDQARECMLRARCALFGRNSHSMMPLVPTHVRLKRTCVGTNGISLGCSLLLPVDTVNCVQTLKVLLNLALSDKTVKNVATHEGIRAGMIHAAEDHTNLTGSAKSLLANLKVRLKMVDAKAQQEQMEHVHMCAASKQRHVMISYCWEQQEVVVRIKQALTARGCRTRVSCLWSAGLGSDGVSDRTAVVKERKQHPCNPDVCRS
jgi:hypothetical protein